MQSVVRTNEMTGQVERKRVVKWNAISQPGAKTPLISFVTDVAAPIRFIHPVRVINI